MTLTAFIFYWTIFNWNTCPLHYIVVGGIVLYLIMNPLCTLHQNFEIWESLNSESIFASNTFISVQEPPWRPGLMVTRIPGNWSWFWPCRTGPGTSCCRRSRPPRCSRPPWRRCRPAPHGLAAGTGFHWRWAKRLLASAATRWPGRSPLPPASPPWASRQTGSAMGRTSPWRISRQSWRSPTVWTREQNLKKYPIAQGSLMEVWCYSLLERKVA